MPALWHERLPDARLVMVQGCGHLPHVEQAATVARHVMTSWGEWRR